MQSSSMPPDTKIRRLSLLLWLAASVFAVSRRMRRPVLLEKLAVRFLRAAVSSCEVPVATEAAAEFALYC